MEPTEAPASRSSEPRRPRLDGLRLFLEFVIVVAGISLSFWLQDLREQRAGRAEEARFLAGFKGELREDLDVLRGQIESLGQSVDRLHAAMDPEKRVALVNQELDQVMDIALTYTGFRGSLATYAELRQTGGSHLIRDKGVLGELIHLYERDYSQAEEWDRINRNFVLERMFPYLEDFGPHVATTLDGTTVSGLHPVFIALENEPRFRNLMRSNSTFKEAQAAVFTALTVKIERAIELLDG